MRRILLLLVSVIPGVSLILLGRVLRGVWLMIGGLFFLNLAMLGFFIWVGPEGPAVGWTGLLIGGGCVAYSVGWTFLTLSPRRQRRRREKAERSLRIAHEAYLRGRLAQAHTAIESGLRCAHADADLLFFAWKLSRAQANGRRGKRLRRRLRRADVTGKWDWEVEMEEKPVEEKPVVQS